MKQLQMRVTVLHKCVAGALRAGLCTTALCVLLLAAVSAQAAEPVVFDIPQLPLPQALKVFAEQSGMQLLYRPDAVTGVEARPVHGRLDQRQALQRLLQGSDLEIVYSGDNAATIRPRNRESGTRRTVPDGDSAPGSPEEAAGRQEGMAAPAASGPVVEMETLVVTGTHIRGGAAVGSPVMAFDREYIHRGGYSSVAEVIEALPQGMGSGASLDGVFLGGSQTNPAYGSAANLRGLGPQSTLTLLNGHRLPSSGTGNFVDLSLIPVSAIERVDVLLDGASSLYGSDAVAGVVNLITDKDFEGAETSLRRGYATSGGAEETRLGQSLGFGSGDFGGLLAYEFQENEPVFGEQRSFTSGWAGPFTIVPAQHRQGALLSTRLDFGETSSAWLDGIYSHRNVTYVNFNPVSLQGYHLRTSNEQYGVAGGVLFPIGQDWSFEVSTGYGENRLDSVAREQAVTREAQDTSLLSGQVKADGSLFRLPAGPIRVAFGLGGRQETLETSTLASDLDRTVRYVFGEVQVPIFSPAQAIRGAYSLDVNLSGRYEDYSDFGSSTNPKIGLSWRPIRALTLRSSYGRSFRAPSLYELDEGSRTNILFDLPDAGGVTRSVLLFGGNAGLQPERSETWTAGVDFRPQDSGFALSATYYRIAYRNRINAITANIFDSLVRPDLGALVTRRGDVGDGDFDAALTRFLSQGTTFLCGVPPDADGHCPEPMGNFGALVDFRTLNLSSTRTAGIDLSVDYAFETDFGPGSAFANINHAFYFRQALVPGGDGTDIIDTVGNPLRFRARGGVVLNPGNWTLAASVNYAGRYRLTSESASEEVDSFTSFDLFVQYAFGAGSGPLQGLSAALSARNVFGREPPRAMSSAFFNEVRYDPANADPVGRFLSLEVRKRW